MSFDLFSIVYCIISADVIFKNHVSLSGSLLEFISALFKSQFSLTRKCCHGNISHKSIKSVLDHGLNGDFAFALY